MHYNCAFSEAGEFRTGVQHGERILKEVSRSREGVLFISSLPLLFGGFFVLLFCTLFSFKTLFAGATIYINLQSFIFLSDCRVHAFLV